MLVASLILGICCLGAPPTPQDLRIAELTQAPRPNVWDLVALILVIGVLVLESTSEIARV